MIRNKCHHYQINMTKYGNLILDDIILKSPRQFKRCLPCRAPIIHTLHTGKLPHFPNKNVSLRKSSVIKREFQMHRRFYDVLADTLKNRYADIQCLVWFGVPQIFRQPFCVCFEPRENVTPHQKTSTCTSYVSMARQASTKETIAKKLLKPFRNSINTINTPSTPSRNTNHVLQTN